MSKTNKDKAAVSVSYSMIRAESGYAIQKIEVQDGKVTKTETVTEPDVLVISFSKLDRLIRKDLGL